MTTLGNVGVVSVEDRAVECLTAIAYVYEDAMDDLAFLERAWEASLPASVAVAKLLATAMSEPLVATGTSEPLVAAEPAEPEMPEADPAETDLQVADLAVADLETATELEIVSGSEAAAEGPTADGGQPDGLVEQVRVLMIAEAVTAELPVQAAA